jgi:hypothetical protein
LAAWAELVDGVVTLVREAAPVGNGEGFGEAGDAHYEVIFSCLDGSLGGVCAMDIWWRVLDIGVLGKDENLHVL